MTPRSRGWCKLGVLVAISVGSIAASACSDDETVVSSGPSVPPSLEIQSLSPVGGPSWTAGSDGCVEVGRDPDQTIVVVLNVSDFSLRPPGTCGSIRQCGVAVLRVDPADENELLRVDSAQEAVPAPFAGLPLGPHTFQVELVSDDGDPVIDEDAGVPLVRSVSVEVKAAGECGGSVDAGPDASDAGTDAPDDATPDAGDAPADAASDTATDAAADVSGDAMPVDAAPDADPDADAQG